MSRITVNLPPDLEKLVVEKGVWVHTKSRKLYEVFAVTKQTKIQGAWIPEPMICYRPFEYFTSESYSRFQSDFLNSFSAVPIPKLSRSL
jgi:hypothetical protein